MAKRKILVTNKDPGGIRAILPVALKLAQEGEVEVVIVGAHKPAYSIFENPQIQELFQSLGITYHRLEDYQSRDGKPLQISQGDLEELLAQENPDLILTGSSSSKDEIPIERLLTMAAKDYGIQTLSVLDGWGPMQDRWDDPITKQRFAALSDKIAIPDKYALEDMIEEGYNQKNLVITGQPAFDILVEIRQRSNEEKQEIRRSVRETLGLPQDEYLVTFATGLVDETPKDVWGFDYFEPIAIAAQAIKRTGTYLALKIHTREKEENISRIKDFLEKYSINYKIIKDFTPNPVLDMRALILSSDLLASNFSTALVEATYLDINAITIQPNMKQKDPIIVSRLDIIPTYRGSNPEEGISILEKAITDKNYQQQMKEKRRPFIESNTGHSTDNVVQLAYQMLGLEYAQAAIPAH